MRVRSTKERRKPNYGAIKKNRCERREERTTLKEIGRREKNKFKEVYFFKKKRYNGQLTN